MSSGSVRLYRKNQIIFSQGAIDLNLYKIMSGKVGFYVGYGTEEEQLIGVSSAPNCFGTTNVFGGRPSNYTAVAIENSTLRYLNAQEVEGFFQIDPSAAAETMRTVTGRLGEVTEAMTQLLDGLRAFCRGEKFGKKELQDLVSMYEYSVDPAMILDKYEEYVPVAEKTAPAEPATAMEQEASSFFLEGHRGYPGVTHPEYKKYLIQIEYTCPHCMNKFRADKILTSRLIPMRDLSEEMRYDLRVYYRDFEAEWYEIVTCPHCYFSSFENYFRDPKSLYKSRYEKKLAGLCDNIALDFTQERDLDFVFAQHYLALACAPGLTDHRQIEARVWMNLIRLYKDAGEDGLSKIAEQKTVEAYQTVYMECELQPGQEQRLCLTVAGMLFAQGEKRAAREWAARVRNGSGDRSAYWNMAEQLIQDVRTEMAAENE